MGTMQRATIVALALAMMMATAPAGSADTLQEAIISGAATLDLRLRYENAEQDTLAEDAEALTIRPRLGYETGTWQGFDAFVEYEGIFAIGGDDEYNSGPPFLDATNGNIGFTTIADPTDSEINRAWLRYRGLASTTFKAGRQRIILDNARFVGNVGWRQNEQTFDAAGVINELLPGVTLTYAYVWRQNFIFFNDNQMDSHLIHAEWAIADALNLTAYGYLIDFDEDNAPRAPGAPDNRVFGLRAAGMLGPVGYTLEYADQGDYADAPEAVPAEYFLVELSAPGLPFVTPTLGYEVLGGDGDFGFQFPLATNHKFQGWADLFLATPPDGVVDAYVKLAAAAPAGIALSAVYHDFGADNGSADYGSEIDLAAKFPVTEGLSLLAKFADYDADTFAVDTRRYWLQAKYAF